jgi:hypothetical protein
VMQNVVTRNHNKGLGNELIEDRLIRYVRKRYGERDEVT